MLKLHGKCSPLHSLHTITHKPWTSYHLQTACWRVITALGISFLLCLHNTLHIRQCYHLPSIVLGPPLNNWILVRMWMATQGTQQRDRSAVICPHKGRCCKKHNGTGWQWSVSPPAGVKAERHKLSTNHRKDHNWRAPLGIFFKQTGRLFMVFADNHPNSRTTHRLYACLVLVS